MTEKNKYEAGMQLRRTMWGPSGAEERVNLATTFNRPFEDLARDGTLALICGAGVSLLLLLVGALAIGASVPSFDRSVRL